MLPFKYQLIFLGDVSCSLCERVKNLFFQKLVELGLPVDCVLVIYPSDFKQSYLNKQPTFAYYMGKSDNDGLDTEILKVLLDNGDAVLPVYFSREHFLNEIPDEIHLLNGFLYEETKLDRLVSCALESFRLLRNKRRVFISYHRDEATGVAQQLYEVLIKNNYYPFLDSYSISPGDDFQEELFHIMTDCDVLIQLKTKDFSESKWCRSEILEANKKQIGIVELIWPDCSVGSYDQLSVPVNLEKDSFESEDTIDKMSILKSERLDGILQTIESLRARNLAARQDNLCGEFIAEASKHDRMIYREYSYLFENDTNGQRRRIFIPAIGVPQSYDCYLSRDFRNLLDNRSLEIYLLYDDLKIKDKWVKHLDWLNDSLDVKTIKKNNFKTWLTNQ